MKFSFSTKGWHGRTFEEFCSVAEGLHFEGIELHNVNGPLFTDKDGAFHGYASAATVRRLYEKKLQLPCIDALCDIGRRDQFDSAVEELNRCIDIAVNLKIKHIRVKAENADDASSAIENTVNFLNTVLPLAEKKKIVIIVETSGLFSKSAVLRGLLDRFASDNLAALLNMSAAYFEGGEQAEEIIKNLGAYVRHVHINDAQIIDNKMEYCLIGEGSLPIKDMMLALRSVNYDGYISLVWDPSWCVELNDMEIIFSQYLGYMKQFSDTSRNERTFYYNEAHTGKFVWKKDLLIDATFSDVLDTMVECFPDQYAFKYTTLDYTRTYSEFRDDVDTFARSLISLGVCAGHKVAVWASNVPQWFIAFWATAKIGAILVTMNTSYKISEAEYLLKQSDTHTLIITEGSKDTNYGEIVALSLIHISEPTRH